MSKQVDIIVTVYNKENTIKQCIDSILAQEYENINVIIIDDGSTDNSYRICAQYGDPRVRLFHQNNAGVGKARNAGISKISGDKVVFVDADDYVSPLYISDLMKYSKYDLVVQGYISCYENGTACKTMIPPMCQVEYQQYGEFLFRKEIYRYMTMLWNKLFDTKLIKDNNLSFRDISTGEDICFIFDYLEYAKKIFISEDTNYHYVLTKGSLSRKSMPDIWERQNDINNYCRKNFYPNYGVTWANVFVRAAKRTLGEAADNKEKFNLQINKIRDDASFKKVKISYLRGHIEKLLFILILSRNKYVLWMVFRFVK